MQRVWKARELSAPATLPGLPPLLQVTVTVKQIDGQPQCQKRAEQQQPA